MALERLAARIREGRFTAGVVGLGYVGVPLAVTIAEAGLNVIGFDISEDVVERVASGASPTVDVSDERIRACLARGLEPTANVADLAEADVIFLCVPSPLGTHREPDISSIAEAASSIASVVTPEVLVCLESTTYPGTTREIVLPALESHGLRLDEDLAVAYSSERVSPGSGAELRHIPKVVGGVSDLSAALAEGAYSAFVDTVHVVPTAEVAEFSKLLENTYRSVNIALINELAQFAHRIGVDIWEAIEAAATKPFGFTPFYPGPGVGGHCIPLDPQYLAWRARREGVSLAFVDTAERVNRSMPRYVVERATELLNRSEQSLQGSRILAVGIAYKRDVADDRESAAKEVVDLLIARGAHVEVLDPMFTDDSLRDRGLVPAERPLRGYDLAILLTDHSGIDGREIATAGAQVLDTRDALTGHEVFRL